MQMMADGKCVQMIQTNFSLYGLVLPRQVFYLSS